MNNPVHLINGINSKQKEAWKMLYSHFYAALCNYASKIIKDRNASEDIVQNIFIKLWDSSVNFPDIGKLTAYLYKSVYSRSLNYLRDKKQPISINNLKQDQTDLQEELYITMAIEEEVVSNLYIALSEMSPQQRQVILLAIGGSNIAEISEKLGISVNTVKTHKKRAYSFLKARLGDSFVIIKAVFLS